VFIRQSALASAQNFQIDKENEAYKLVMNNTNITTTDLNKFLFYSSLMEHPEGKLLVGVDNAIVNSKN